MTETPNPTAVLVFANATLMAIRLATNPNESAKVQRQAEKAAYSNARAAGRAALRYLEAR